MENSGFFCNLVVKKQNSICSWGPTAMLPIFELLGTDYKDVKILKVDVDEASTLADQFRINAVPTLIMFKDKKPISVMQGYMTYDELEEWIKSQRK